MSFHWKVFKLRYSLSNFLTNCTLNPKGHWLHCQERFPPASSRKRNFGRKKCFSGAGACSSDAKVSLPGQTNLAWVQLLPHWISKLLAIWLNSTAFQNPPKMPILSTYSNFCKPSVLVCFLKQLLEQWLLTCIHWPGLATFVKNSKSAKMPIFTIFHYFAYQMDCFTFENSCCSNGQQYSSGV